MPGQGGEDQLEGETSVDYDVVEYLRGEDVDDH